MTTVGMVVWWMCSVWVPVASADAVTDMYGFVSPGDSALWQQVDAMAACPTSSTLEIGGGGATISGVAVYVLEEHNPFGVNKDAFGGAVAAGASITPYIAVRRDAFAGLDAAACAQFLALMMHELQHAVSWNWWLAQCLQTGVGAQACIDCVMAIDDCLKKQCDGENAYDESRANFLAALCLCKQACALPPGEQRDALEAEATAHHAEARRLWDVAEDAFENHCAHLAAQCGYTQEGPDGVDVGKYPMPPLNPGGSPEIDYDGPTTEASGQTPAAPMGMVEDPPGSGEYSCDCGFSLGEDLDPCELGGLDG